MDSLHRLAVHTMTTRPWTLGRAMSEYAAAGIGGISIWREHLDSAGDAEARRLLDDSPLELVSLVRGGFFVAPTETDRRRAVDENLRLLERAAAIGAPLLVLVCGAVPGMPPETARAQIAAAIEQILPRAETLGVRLGVEPLHPMYADTRSAIATLAQANDLVEAFDHSALGIVLDVYHTWWDELLEREIERAGKRIFAFHVCDWRTPTRDLINDREIMGRGCIDISRIRRSVESAGFNGFIEVEVFSNDHWKRDQRDFLADIVYAFRKFV